MPSTYSDNLKIQLMATGEDTGLWGEYTNTNLGGVVEQALTGQSTVPVADSSTPTPLISVPGTNVGDTARSLYVKLTGALTATRTVTTIAAKHFYIIENSTTGGQAISFASVGGGTAITVPFGQKVLVYCDGTNVVPVVTYLSPLVAVITGGSIDGATIGSTTPSSGVFTSGSAQTFNISVGGTLNGVTLTNATGNFASVTISSVTINGGTLNNVSIGAVTPGSGAFTSLSSTSGSVNATIGAVTRNPGSFTTLSSTGAYTNTVPDGSTPMQVTSTTRVNNLNVARSGYSDAAAIDTDSTNATFYVPFVAATSGQQALKTISGYNINPSTGALAVPGAFTSGSLTPAAPLGTAYGGTGTTTGLLPPRVVSVVSGTSITPNADTTDILTQANVGVTGTITINAPTGTPINGQKLMMRLSTVNAQTLSYNAIYASSTDIALPNSISANTTNYLGFIYNSTSSKWQLLAKVFGFA